MTKTIQLVCIAMWLLTSAALGQTQPETPRDNKQGDRTTQRPQTRLPTQREETIRPLFISGSVALEGGAPIAGVVQVQLKCNGSVRESIYTSPDGSFSFTLGSSVPSTGQMDASIGGRSFSTTGPNLSGSSTRDPFREAGLGSYLGFGRVDLSSCDCEAFLPGYQAAPVALGIRSVFDSPDVGVITLYPLGNTKGGTVSLNTLNAPKKAMDAYKKAIKELSKQKVNYKNVTKHLLKATEIYPEFAASWQILGEAYLAQGNEIEAQKAFQQALAADPQYVMPYVALAELEIQKNHWEEASQLTGQAIELNPYVVRAHYFHALAQYSLQKPDEAVKSIQVVQSSSEAHLYPASHYLLGGIHANRGEFDAAALEFRRFLATNPPESVAAQLEQTINRWEQGGVLKEQPQE